MREIWVIVNIASLWHCTIAPVLLWSMCEILIDDLMIEYHAYVDTWFNNYDTRCLLFVRIFLLRANILWFLSFL